MIKNILRKKNVRIAVCVSILLYLFVSLNGLQFVQEVATSALNYLETTFYNGTNTVEVKKVSFETPGYKDSEPGHYEVIKEADWISEDQALIEFNVKTTALTNGKKKDVIFVVDTSGSMIGDKYARLTEDASELITQLLKDQENTVSLIAFDSEVEILRTYSKDKDDLITTISNMEILGATDYYLALTAVEEVLSTYVPSEDRDCIVVFLTDGFPTQSNSNQLAAFKIINLKYPYAKVHGIQYEMGIDITEELKEVSHKQYSIDMESLRNVLFEAALQPVPYDDFELIDYIDNRYFYVESESDIEASYGTASLVEENGKQKVVWNVSSTEFFTGSAANLKIKVKFKDEYYNSDGLFPTNEEVEVNATLENTPIDEKGPYTPILSRKYNVYYDMNTPTGCNLENFDGGKYTPFSTVEKSSVKPTCQDYIFLGWEAATDVEYINDDYFIMPPKDVTFKAVWSTFSVDKTMDGQVYEVLKLYDVIKKQSVLDNISSEYVEKLSGIDFTKASSDTNGKGVYTLSSTLLNEYPIYYYRGEVDNNVIFAGYCWKIIRTTDTGGIKMIYNGVPSAEGYCNNTGASTAVAHVPFSASNAWSSPSHGGYMYNAGITYKSVTYSSQSSTRLFGNSFTYDDATGEYTLVDTKTFDELVNTDSGLASHHYTCLNDTGTCTTINFAYLVQSNVMYYTQLTGGNSIEDLFDSWFNGENSNINVKNSNVKTSVDNWYSSNMTGYTKYLENAVYCNDRSINDLAGFNPNGEITLDSNYLMFAAFDRAIYGTPTLDCRQVDSFTLGVENGGTAGYGNNALIYPVGLISSDEVLYAGATPNQGSLTNYLYSGEMYWPMTPYRFRDYRMSVFIVYGSYNPVQYSGSLNGGYSYSKNATYGVRPVISLRNDTSYTIGDGSATNPYQVLIEE